MLNKFVSYIFISCLAFLTCCSNYMPKPRGYFRITLPEKSYVSYSEKGYPYTFEIPDISKVEKHATTDDPYWIDIVYPALNAKIYCSYKPVKGNLQEITEDARNFVYKHTQKADDITEQPYQNDSLKVYAMFYELKGNTASNIQFVATDSVKHFFRGALYFNNTPNKDSIAPVQQFVREDIIHIIETLEWR